MSDDPPTRLRAMPVLLVVLPLWLVVSGVFAVWYFLRQEKLEALEERQRFARSVSAPMIGDDLRKITGIIGERHVSSETGARNLGRAASMIEGLLGPANTGYQLVRHRGPGEHPLPQVTIRGQDGEAPAVWVLASYDSRPGSPGAEGNASGLAASLAAAQALADHQPLATIHFLFIPHANDRGSPVAETVAIVQQLATAAGPPAVVLCVEAMGAGEELWLSSLNADAEAFGLIGGLGFVKSADAVNPGGVPDLTGLLSGAGLPAVRVSTRPVLTAEEADDTVAIAEIVAASSGRLVELIRRCAAKRPASE